MTRGGDDRGVPVIDVEPLREEQCVLDDPECYRLKWVRLPNLNETHRFDMVQTELVRTSGSPVELLHDLRGHSDVLLFEDSSRLKRLDAFSGRAVGRVHQNVGVNEDHGYKSLLD